MTESEMIFRLVARYPQLVVKDAEVAVNAILEAMITCLVMGQRMRFAASAVLGSTTGRRVQAGIRSPQTRTTV